MRALVAVTLLIACKDAPPPGEANVAKGAREGAAPSGPPLVEKPYYRLDVASAPACAVNAACDVKLRLTALGGHHVNEDYPTKFVPEASADFAVVGKPAFTVDTATTGTMSIKVTPSKAGALTLSGQFKLGVCTDDKCEIDGPTVQVAFTST